MKKILILTVTAGNGHNSCAKSVKEQLEKVGNGVEIKVIDVLKEYSNPGYVWFADEGYNIAVSRFPKLYKIFYDGFKRSKPERRYSCGATKTALTIAPGLMEEILAFQPDVIYCSHFYGAMAITYLKLVYDLPFKTVVSSLDYVNSPFWEACIGVDYFTVPNEDFVEENIREGFRKEQILPIGLPIHEKFYEPIDKATARQKLGLRRNAFTIMVMFGGGFWSGGFKIFRELVSILSGKKVNIIMINGKNKHSFNRVKKMHFDEPTKVYNVGFTDQMPLYMSACDVIINKCGGPSTTEIINRNVPMLVTENVPAQEEYNLEYLKNKSATLSFKNKKELKNNILTLMEDKPLCECVKKNQKKLQKNATKEIAELILSFDSANYDELNKQKIDKKTVKNLVTKAVRKQDKLSKNAAR
jgi:processive 1,2-diacylglycerol beta-glucosyltransferase